MERRLRTLLEPTRRLSASIDYKETLVNVVEFVAEHFASYALLDVVTEPGRIERVAVAHSDPSRTHLVEAIKRFHPPVAPIGSHPVANAVANVETTLESIDDAWIERSALNVEHAEAMRRLEIRQLLVVPVLARTGSVVGALTCALDVYGRGDYDADDIAFAEEIGHRAGLAIENARLFEHERRIAVVLQKASLPSALPQIPDTRLDAFYRPGNAEATVGGDWYDAFANRDGLLVLSIGDVAGSGLHAAVTMTKLRQSMQAAALLQPNPQAMLDVADETLRMHDPHAFATALAAIYDRRNGTLAIASAGHPSPLHRHPDGTIEALDDPGLMLGVDCGAVRPVATFAIEPGSSVVFFTDGLTECTKDFAEGERLLLEAVAECDFARGADPARSIVDRLSDYATHPDDIAILTLSAETVATP